MPKLWGRRGNYPSFQSVRITPAACLSMRVVFVPGEQLRSWGTRSKISNMREWKRLLGGDVRERRHEPWVPNHDEVRRRDEEAYDYDDIAREVQEAKNAAEAQATDDRTIRAAVQDHAPDHVLRP